MSTEQELELKQLFLDETSQNLEDTEQCFLALETSPDDPAIIENIFRLAHNLKGNANAVGFSQLGALTHDLESYLIKIKNGLIKVDGASVNLLLRSNDQIIAMVAGLRENLNALFDISGLQEEIRAHLQGGVKEDGLDLESKADPALVQHESPGETAVDMSWEEIDALIAAGGLPPTVSGNDVSDPIVPEQQKSSKPATPSPSIAVSDQLVDMKKDEAIKKALPNAPTGDESIRVSLQRVEKLLNFVGEMVILQTVLKEQVNNSDSVLLRKTVRQLGKVSKEVQEIAMSLRMVPLKPTMQKMQRIVRDTSSELGKKVQLELRGEDTEVDKTILERLGDPLVHLVRNAVDHGIEKAETRLEQGKPEGGTICLSAYHRGGRLVIEVSDDGGGMDPDRLRAKAVEKGIIKPNALVSDKEALMLIFSAGFSTKEVVSNISGRGVGMDVVKNNIEQLQGEIEIDTEVGKGTCFRILLPLTLAIMDGMTVLVDSQRYVIPLSQVHESTRPLRNDVHHVSGMGNVYSLRGDQLPLYHLSHLLGHQNKALKPPHESTVIVVRATAQPFAVVVDSILEQYEVVIKKLGDEHENLRGISGSAILGDGRVALILELPELVSRRVAA